MSSVRQARIQLCGQLVVELDGRRVESLLPGPQGRLLFAFLVDRRDRPTLRSELVEAVWPYGPPRADAVALKALLSKVRTTIGRELLPSAANVCLVLPRDAHIDVEAAREAIHRAESGVARGAWKEAYGPAAVSQFVTSRPFLPGLEAPWIDERRRELADLHIRALHCTSTLSIRIGGTELPTGERAARELIRLSPFRESAYLLLMEALRARGDNAEALRVYDELRVLLRESLGTSPGPEIRGLHRSLLGE